jgi:alpha-tubulin suppressor-like RCC1 family protein
MSWVVFKNGSIFGWGSGFCGQLENPPLTNVVSISSGQDHTLALLSNGTVAGWGCNQQDQLDLPPEVLGLTGRKVVKVVAGSFHNLALLDNGEVVSWGYSWDGLTNVPETAKRDVVDIAAGDAHSLVLRSDGSVIGWGRDDSGQVSKLIQQAGTGKVVAIAAGGNQSYALTGDCCFRPLSTPPPSKCSMLLPCFLDNCY